MDKRHFVDGQSPNSDNQKVTDMLRRNTRQVTIDEYNLILDNVVINCVDVALVTNDLKVLMARRRNEPYKDGLAFPGGRQIPGESYGDTAARHVRKNTGLDIDPSRFRFVRSDSWLWSLRAQPPQERGCHMNGITVVVMLTPDEVMHIQYSDDIFKDDIFKPEWLTLQEVSAREDIHPSHRNAADDILNGKID